MISSRGMYMRNASYIIPIWRYICNAYVNELSKIAGDGLKEIEARVIKWQ